MPSVKLMSVTIYRKSHLNNGDFCSREIIIKITSSKKTNPNNSPPPLISTSNVGNVRLLYITENNNSEYEGIYHSMMNTAK